MPRKKSITQIIQENNIPIKDVKIARGLLNNPDKLLNDLGLIDQKILFISDENLESKALEVFKKITNCKVKSILILNRPKADDKNIKIIEDNFLDFTLIIGFGSGTINDLCKIVSFQKHIPYIIFASAPSMNGYASANSSIMINGHKKTLLAHQATAIYCDLDILSNSPEEMIKAGIGDILCHTTCQFDWKLSHLILQTPFIWEVFDMIWPYQLELLNFSSQDFRQEEFIYLLTSILIISGLAMYLCKGSYPASQSEHLIAHFLDMKYPKLLEDKLHGNQIALTTFTVIKIQEEFLKVKYLKLRSYSDIDLSKISKIFDGNTLIAQECWEEFQKKREVFTENKLQIANKNLDKIKVELKDILSSKDHIMRLYKMFDLAYNPDDFNISKEIYEEALSKAYLIRNRLTILDFEIFD